MGWDGIGLRPPPILKRCPPGTMSLTCQSVSGSPALDSGLQATADFGRPGRRGTRTDRPAALDLSVSPSVAGGGGGRQTQGLVPRCWLCDGRRLTHGVWREPKVV